MYIRGRTFVHKVRSTNSSLLLYSIDLYNPAYIHYYILRELLTENHH